MTAPGAERHTILVLCVTIVVSALVVSAGWIAFDVWSAPPPRCTGRTAVLSVDQATWQLSAQRGLYFDPSDKIRLDYRGAPTFCGSAGAAPVRLDSFGLKKEALRTFVARDAEEFAALADVEQIVIGGPIRIDPLPHPARAEVFGPPMFGRPTVSTCKPFRDFSGREFPWCKLWGWAPGGVAVTIWYEDAGDEARRVQAVEQVVKSLRR